MKKIAGILICIALAFTFAACSWEIPEKVSVKTNADYNFALGNIEKDFSSELNVSKMIGDLELPNNGKVYDYWPDKKDNTQKYLMYMPLQEIPIDIGSYFDKGILAEKIKSISFSKDIKVPEVKVSFPVDFDLNEVNTQINRQFVLAGVIDDYNSGEFGDFLSQIAQSITYEKGYLVVKAYSLGGIDPSSITSIQNAITDENNVDTSYNYGSVSITSGGKSISGTFYNGVAVLEIPSAGFEFKSSDINISFTNKPNLFGVPTNAFIARMDTSRPYQIKKISGIGPSVTVAPIDIEKNDIDALSSLTAAGVEECTIGEGSIELNFDIPSEWENVSLAYYLTTSGGIALTSGPCTAASGGNNKENISLDGTSISAEKVDVDGKVTLNIAGATIDFTKSPALKFTSDIKEIETVTVKLSDTSLAQNATQKLPDEALNILKKIKIGQCGIEGTYTNTLPGGVDNAGNPINAISMTVSSHFFGLDSETQTIEGGKTNQAFKLLNSDSETYTREIQLTKDNPVPNVSFNAFDFDVTVALPGGDSDKVTVRNVRPGETYSLAIEVTPVINWESVTLDTSSLPSKSDKMATGFNPSSIFKSIDDVLGDGFSDNIEIPDCNLYLYLTKPNLSVLNNLSFSDTSISMFYGTKEGDNPPVKIESFQKDIIKNGTYLDQNNQVQEINFAAAAPDLTIEQFKSIEKTEEDGKTVEKEVVTDTVVSAMSASDASCVIKLSDLLTSVPEANVEGAELCIEYSVSLVDPSGDEEIPITKEDLDKATTNVGSIGIYAIIELPLSFTVTGNTDIDLKKIMNKDDEESEDKDLFSRDNADGMEDVEKYLEAIESAKLAYRLDAFPITSTKDIMAEIVLSDDNSSVYEKKIDLSMSGSNSFEIRRDEISNILNAYPLKLGSAKITIPENNEISIPRTKKIDVNLQIGLKTDGTIELFGDKN